MHRYIGGKWAHKQVVIVFLYSMYTAKWYKILDCMLSETIPVRR